jgi:type VI secretion system protein VasI
MKAQTYVVLFIFGSTLFGTCHAAEEETLSNQIRDCKRIENDIARLVCFDEIGSRDDAISQLERSTQSVGKWVVTVDINPIDDSQVALATLLADAGRSSFDNPVGLAIRCSSGEVSAYINWSDYLGDSAEVLTRIGSKKARTFQWSLSTNHQATFYPHDPRSFITQLIKVDKLVAQVTPYNESPITAIFDLTGMDRAMQPVRDACSWYERPKRKRQHAFRGPIYGEIMHDGLGGATFIVENGKIVIQEVKINSQAKANGLEQDDIVVSVNDMRVTDLDALNTAVSGSDAFDLIIDRAGETRSIPIR